MVVVEKKMRRASRRKATSTEEEKEGKIIVAYVAEEAESKDWRPADVEEEERMTAIKERKGREKGVPSIRGGEEEERRKRDEWKLNKMPGRQGE